MGSVSSKLGLSTKWSSAPTPHGSFDFLERSFEKSKLHKKLTFSAKKFV